MHDSLNPLAGMVADVEHDAQRRLQRNRRWFLKHADVIIVAVFLAGLMVGRTPEYLGKKVESREVKLAMIAMLLHPLLILAGAGLFAATDWGAKTTANPGSHGFSEILYEFTSSAANNGSGFEGLGDNTPAWNVACGIVLLLGRFPAAVAADRTGRVPGREEARAVLVGDSPHRQPDLCLRCCWARCCSSVRCRSCRPSCSDPWPTT